MQNLSILSSPKTVSSIPARRQRSTHSQLLEQILGAAEAAILDSSQADAIIAQVGGLPYRIRLRTVDGCSDVIVAIVDSARATVPNAPELRTRFGFTEREAEVARLLAARLSNKEIARALRVTTYTAERHTERILDKLGINSRRHVQAAIATAR